jgi:hypothetical protein
MFVAHGKVPIFLLPLSDKPFRDFYDRKKLNQEAEKTLALCHFEHRLPTVVEVDNIAEWKKKSILFKDRMMWEKVKEERDGRTEGKTRITKITIEKGGDK